ncbi:hypothetical protein M0802_011286 [Mischocyttarus mexicanus]|nr:hypothetical protein M0802_011286 [Mischocyttarus mexicanus]
MLAKIAVTAVAAAAAAAAVTAAVMWLEYLGICVVHTLSVLLLSYNVLGKYVLGVHITCFYDVANLVLQCRALLGSLLMQYVIGLGENMLIYNTP